MHGWEAIETARCERCRIFTPRTDLLFGRDGRCYCVGCGVPAAASAAQPTEREDDGWVRVTRPTEVAWARTRVVACVMVAVTLAFPLAACVSQL